MTPAPALIEFLAKAAPADLRRLKSGHPGNPSLFTATRTLGEAAAPPQADRTALLDLVRASLAPTTADIDRIAAAVRATMRKVAHIRFTGALVAAIFAGLTGFLSLALSQQLVAATSAFVSMLGSIATLFADQFERAPSGARIAAPDEYAKLVETRATIELIRIQTERDSVFPVSQADIAAALTTLDKAAIQLLRLRLA